MKNVQLLIGMVLLTRWRVDEDDNCDPTITSILGEAVYYRSELSIYPIPSSGI